MSSGAWAKPVMGRPMPLLVSSCRECSLSRAQRAVEGEDAHGLELPHQGGAVEQDAGADARDYRVEIVEGFALVVDGRALGGDVHVAMQGVDHPHLMTALPGRLHQAAG